MTKPPPLPSVQNAHGNRPQDHRFPKKFIMLPWPAFGPALFLPPLVVVEVVEDVGSCNFLVGAGAGSSSEKDSQVGSSCVTVALFSH